MKDFEPVDGGGGAGLLKERVDGALVDGAVGLGVEKVRGGDVTFGTEVFGTEKERLPELKLFGVEKDRDFAMAGMANRPMEKTTATTRARMRLTQVHGRMVPHPPGWFSAEEFPIGPGRSCWLSRIKTRFGGLKVRGVG